MQLRMELSANCLRRGNLIVENNAFRHGKQVSDTAACRALNTLTTFYTKHAREELSNSNKLEHFDTEMKSVGG